MPKSERSDRELNFGTSADEGTVPQSVLQELVQAQQVDAAEILNSLDSVTGAGLAKSHTEKELHDFLKEAVSEYDLPEPVLAVLAKTGAATVGAAAAQLGNVGSQTVRCSKLSLRSQLGPDGAKSILVKFMSRGIFQPSLSNELCGLYGIWREKLLDESIAQMEERKRAPMGTASPGEREELLHAISYAFAFPKSHTDIFKDNLTYDAATLIYRCLYAPGYAARMLDTSEERVQAALAEMRRKLGHRVWKLLQKLQESNQEIAKRMSRGRAPWFCDMLMDLYPESCTESFFAGWQPMGGLKYHEGVLEDCIRSVCMDIPGCGSGDALIQQFNAPSHNFYTACEYCGTPPWKMRPILQEMKKRLRLDVVREVMLRGFPIGSFTVSQNLDQELKESADLERIPIEVLNLGGNCNTILLYRFHVRTLDGLAQLFWPEPELAASIRCMLTDDVFYLLRAYLLFCGLGAMMQEVRDSRWNWEDLNRMVEVTCELLRGLGQDTYVDRMNRMPGESVLEVMRCMRRLINGWEQGAGQRLDPEEYRLLHLHYFYHMPLSMLAFLLGRKSGELEEVLHGAFRKLLPDVCTCIERLSKPNFSMSQARGAVPPKRIKEAPQNQDKYRTLSIFELSVAIRALPRVIQNRLEEG